MKESFWGVFIISMGLIGIAFVFLFQNITNTDEHNMQLLKETTEAAMYDAIDLGAYRKDGTVKINREKFVENFVRRFADSVTLSTTYEVSFYEIYEAPPKVSVKVSSSSSSFNIAGDTESFDIVNKLDAILEMGEK